MQSAGKQKRLRRKTRPLDPTSDRFAGLLSDLELYWPLGLLLHHDGPGRYSLALRDVPNSELHQVASPQLAVDGQVK
jgi:hypothetical protein